MKSIRYISLLTIVACSVVSLSAVEAPVVSGEVQETAVAALSKVKKAAEEFVQAKDSLATARKKDKDFASAYKDHRNALASFKNTFKALPADVKEDHIDLATQVSQKVEGLKEGKSAKQLIYWGSKFKARKPRKTKNGPPEPTTFEDLTHVAKDFVAKHTIVAKQEPYDQLQKATKKFKNQVKNYIEKGGEVSTLLESLQFVHDQKAIKQINEWIKKGVIEITDVQ